MGIREILNQPDKHISEKNRSLKDMERLIYEAEHVLYIDDNKGNTMVKGYHYFKIIIAEEPSYLVVREMEYGSYYAYSIVDRLKREIKALDEGFAIQHSNLLPLTYNANI